MSFEQLNLGRNCIKLESPVFCLVLNIYLYACSFNIFSLNLMLNTFFNFIIHNTSFFFSPVMMKVLSRRNTLPSTPPRLHPLPHSGTETSHTTPMSMTKSASHGTIRRITQTLMPMLTQTVKLTAVIMQ